MSLTEHAILHRRVEKRYKGTIREETPQIDFIDDVLVSELTAEEINRDLFGTRVEGMLKIIIWGQQRYYPQDRVELNGSESDIGKGDMFEIIRMIKDVRKISNFSVYVMKRLQTGDIQ